MISKSNVKTNSIRIESINTSLESIKEEYNLGTKTITELIEAETQLLEANVNYFSSTKDFILNYFNLIALQGSILDNFANYLPDYN